MPYNGFHDAGQGAPFLDISTIIFDWDQTLLDSWSVHRDALQHAARAQGVEPPDEKTVQLTFSGTLEGQIRTLFGDPKPFLAPYQEYYRAHHTTQTALFPGVSTLLLSLQERSFRLAILSNKTRRTAVEEMEATGVLQAFDLMVFRDDLGSMKPDPEGLQALLSSFETAPHETLLVGDSPSDMVAARAAGVWSAAALWGSLDVEEVLAQRPSITWHKVQEALRFCINLPFLESNIKG